MTDNECDAQTIREALELARELPLSVPSAHIDGLHRLDELVISVAKPAPAFVALARLVAALSTATTERDEARKWANTMEHERDWETQVVHFELLQRAEALAAQLQQAREALEDAEWNGSAWIGLETCPVCGNERVEGHGGDCPVGAALAAAAPATTLNEPEGET